MARHSLLALALLAACSDPSSSTSAADTTATASAPELTSSTTDTPTTDTPTTDASTTTIPATSTTAPTTTTAPIDTTTDQTTTTTTTSTLETTDPLESSTTTTPTICGDGILTDDEACDDGNQQPDDGCSPQCALEIPAEVIIKGTNLPLEIPNDLYTGVWQTMACVKLDVDVPGEVADVILEVAIDHPFLGDLTFKLFSPDDEVVLTVMSLPGTSEWADNGIDTSPEGSDLAKSHPIRFFNAGSVDAELMGADLDATQTVCKDDGICDYSPNPGKGPGLNFFDFVGLPAAGTWRFCAGDSAFKDTGSIAAVTLELALK